MIKNFAHRGFSGKYPENTLLAFQKAIEVQADGIELDVQLTKDGEIVIIHDESIDRTTNGKGLVVDYTYDQLKEFDASYIYTGKFGFNKIPTLREYFNLIKGTNIITNIELKTGIFEYVGIEEKVFNLIKEFKLEDRVIISSFNHYSVLRMKALAPNIKCGFLTETWILNPGKYTKDNCIECYHPHFAILTPDIVKSLKTFGIEINTWTVNKEDEIRDLISKKVDILIGNFPDLTKRILDAQ
ncbi:MAG: glycerophosphodiester phosphodiesterase [Fusobacterium sp.]|nr:glycerophosphodiester phosphodiesterase [Fusobacterium sp.]